MRRKHIGFLIGNISSKGGAERTFSLIANGLIDYYDITVISYIYGEYYENTFFIHFINR